MDAYTIVNISSSETLILTVDPKSQYTMGLQCDSMDLYGDILEAVVTRVPTIDLIPASRVSREWQSAVRSSLRRHPRQSPFLILRYFPHPTSPLSYTHAFDPFSSSWLSLPGAKPDGRVTFLKGSNGDRLHTLTVSKIAVSEDPFGAVWRQEAKAPKVWRQDAVVAELGRWIVVAGGGCPMVLDEGEEVGAVEVLDKETSAWESAEPLPAQFDGSPSATWLSVAAAGERVCIMEKKSGVAGSFDPRSKRWGSATCQPKPDPTVQSWAIASGRGGAVLVVGMAPAAAAAQSGMITKVKFSEINPETMRPAEGGSEEEMPAEMAGKLFPIRDEEDDGAAAWRSSSVEVCGTERGGYVYNPSEMGNGAVFYEFAEGKGRMVGRWEWVPLPERVGDGVMGRIELGCSAVGLSELAPFSRN